MRYPLKILNWAAALAVVSGSDIAQARCLNQELEDLYRPLGFRLFDLAVATSIVTLMAGFGILMAVSTEKRLVGQ